MGTAASEKDSSTSWSEIRSCATASYTAAVMDLTNDDRADLALEGELGHPASSQRT
jgi:hypothetical protein